MPIPKSIILTLTDWQKRMVADFARKADVNKIKISIIDRRQWVMYRVPVLSTQTKAWNLYLTAAQIKKVSAAFGGEVKPSALSISADKVKAGAIEFVK